MGLLRGSSFGDRASPPSTSLGNQKGDVLIHDDVDHVVATARLTGERRRIKVRMHCAHVFRLDGDSRIVEAWGFVADQAALDEFFGS